MLRHLDIRDMLIIDRLDLTFEPGLTVLTGETGAGKSILLDCLGFVLGWRGRADLTRAGAAQGEVTAEFDLPPHHPATAVLADAGLPTGDRLLLRRTNSPEGRKSAWVNDRRASGEVLRALSATLVELHGQGDDRGLLNPRGHRDLLDAFGGLADRRAATAAAWRARSAAAKAVADAEAETAALAAEEAFLRHAVGELEALSPRPGEDATLDADRRRMQAAERLRGEVARVAEALGPHGAEGALGSAGRWLDPLAADADGALDDAVAALDRAMAELSEAAAAVDRFADGLDFESHALEAAEERLFAIRALARKHGVLPDDLADLAADLASRLDRLDTASGTLADLRAAEASAAQAYDAAAATLTEARRAAAAALDAAMAEELAPLKLDRARFRTEVTAAEPGPGGADTVTFTVATAPGASAGPLDKIASGGELSRFLLALKVCLTGGEGGQTLIFDEIDRGVGGATADAVGRRLRRLAEGGQVLVVTHSPQVAALGAHHWRVQKEMTAATATSRVVRLAPDERIDEVARMLAGDRITEAAREAARALLTMSDA